MGTKKRNLVAIVTPLTDIRGRVDLILEHATSSEDIAERLLIDDQTVISIDESVRINQLILLG